MRWLAPAVVLILALSSPAQSRTWHVLPDGTGDAPTIQAAIDSSAAGDSVLVAAGTYVENVVTQPARLLIGSWDPAFTQFDVELHPSTVDGDSAGACITADFGGEQDSVGILAGFVLTNGAGRLLPDLERYGGALYADGLWRIRDCVVEDSWAFSGAGAFVKANHPELVNLVARLNTLGYLGPDGGGLHLEAKERATIDSCHFEANGNTYGGTKGLGLSVFGPRVEISNSQILHNSTYTRSCLYGCGLYAESDSLVVTDCVIANNNWIDWPAPNAPSTSVPQDATRDCCIYDAYGGGVYAAGAARIERCLIYRNAAEGWYFAFGGGLWLASGIVRDCVLLDNIALGNEDDGYGGAIYGGSVVVERCDIRLNKAGGQFNGVGSAVSAGNLVVRNSTIVRNTSHASHHARAIVRANSLEMVNTTVAHNSVYRGNPWEDTVVAIEAGAGEVSNCAVVLNTTNSVDDPQIVGGISGPLASRYNLFWNNTGHPHHGLSSEVNSVVEEPAFADSTYRLRLHSPAIDRGDPAILDPDGSRSDIGAYGGPGADMAQPPRVTGLTAVRTPAGIALEWDANAAPDLAGYAIYRLPTPDTHPGLENFLTRTTGTTLLDPVGPPWPHWYYRLSAYNLDTYGGGYSDAVTASRIADLNVSTVLGPDVRLVSPNPSAGHVALELTSPGPASAAVEVFDVTGRRVWLSRHEATAGTTRVDWPGRDASGRLVAPGHYFVRLRLGAQQFQRKVVIVR